jgi:hypothetical protein
MRTATTRVISGKIAATGVVVSGEMTCKRTTAGIYVLYMPPGKKLIDIVVTPTNGIQWTLMAIDQDTDTSCRVIAANTAGTVNVDVAFRYIATIEG